MSAGGGTSRAGASLARMGSRLAGRSSSFTVEREKELQEAFIKACSNQEMPPKEKHVRTITISTWQERTAQTFWMMLQRLPYQSQPHVCWKLLIVIHKVVLNGHPCVIRESIKWVDVVEQIRRHWNYCENGYPLLIALYAKLIRQKIIFHRKWPVFPSTLDVQDKQWKLPENDINLYFQLAVDCFEYLETMLRLVKMIKDSLSGSAQFTTQMINCRLCPHISIVPESYHLYGIIVRIMQRLYSSLPRDTLEGHAQRFRDLYRQLGRFYVDCAGLEYLGTLVGIPTLDDRPPDFIKHSTYVVPPRPRDPEPVEPVTEELISLGDSERGSNINDRATDSPPPPDDRDELIQQLLREVCELRQKLMSALQNCKQHGNDIRELEQARNVVIEQKRSLEVQVTDLKATPQKEEELSAKVTESEQRWRDSVERCEKLKQAYANLRQEHITLLRSNAETKNTLESQQQLLNDITAQLESKTAGGAEQVRNLEIQVLKLDADRGEARRRATSIECELNTLSSEQGSVRHQNAELQNHLENAQEEAEHALLVAEQLKADIQRISGEKLKLNRQMEEDRSVFATTRQMDRLEIEQATSAKGERECFMATVEHIRNHQNRTMYILNKSDCDQTCSLDGCSRVIHNVESTVKNIVMNQRWATLCAADKLSDLQVISQELSIVALCVRGVMASLSSDKSSHLHNKTEDTINSYITSLETLTPDDNLSVTVGASTKALSNCLEDIIKAHAKEETSLDDIVDQEMAATAASVAEATARIQELFNQTRQQYTGIELEVGEKILGSCTDLMASVRTLILASAKLQKEIVNTGKTAGGTATEFYKRHSRWTEGLLSAAKAVGWGASTLVTTADDVVSGTGKFEQLEVTSHEIAASTAQLVAASRVKAPKESEHLEGVKIASKSVAEATAGVVAASKHCMRMTEESKLVAVDYSQLSAVQVKRLDMEMQVKILEMENALVEERKRLTSMRKMHYHDDGLNNGS